MDINNMNRNSLSALLLSLSSIALAAPRPPRPTEGFVPSQRSPTSSGTISTRPRSAGLHSRRQPRSVPPGMMSLPENVRPNNSSPSVSLGGGIRKRTATDAFGGPAGRPASFARRGSMPVLGHEGIKRARTWGGEASRRLAPPIPSLPPPAAWQAQQNPQLPQPLISPPVNWRHHQLPPLPGASSGGWPQNEQQNIPQMQTQTQQHQQQQHHHSQLQLPQVLPPPSWRLSPQQHMNMSQNQGQQSSHLSHEPVPQHTESWQQFTPGPLSAPVPDWNAMQQQAVNQWHQQLVLPLPQQRPRSTPVTFSPLHDGPTSFATTLATTLATLPSPPIVPSMPTLAQLNEMGSGSSTALASPARSA